MKPNRKARLPSVVRLGRTGQGQTAGQMMTRDMAFVTSRLIRAAHLRADGAALAELAKHGRILPIWRGKPLMANDGGLAYVAQDSTVLASAKELIFLGLDPEDPPATGGIFAADISDWSPEAGAEGVASGFLDMSVQTHPGLSGAVGFADLRGALGDLTGEEGEIAAVGKALVHWHRSHRFCANCGQESQSAMGGWQRDCSACGAHHFPRTDPVVIMLVVRNNRLLLGRSPGWPEAMFSCLAGFMEPGETLEAAVRREVLEETGVQIGKVQLLANQPWPFPASLMLGCLAEAESERITIDPAEIEEALWLDKEDVVRALAGVHPKVSAARPGTIARRLMENWVADRLF